jgi:hypothetical protein
MAILSKTIRFFPADNAWHSDHLNMQLNRLSQTATMNDIYRGIDPKEEGRNDVVVRKVEMSFDEPIASHLKVIRLLDGDDTGLIMELNRLVETSTVRTMEDCRADSMIGVKTLQNIVTLIETVSRAGENCHGTLQKLGWLFVSCFTQDYYDNKSIIVCLQYYVEWYFIGREMTDDEAAEEIDRLVGTRHILEEKKQDSASPVAEHAITNSLSPSSLQRDGFGR